MMDKKEVNPIPKELFIVLTQKYGASEDVAHRVWTEFFSEIPKEKLSIIIDVLKS